jgi:hypothetical protein
VKHVIFIGLIILSLASCGHKYEMTNMLPEIIDVTSYIESGRYRPDSCEGRLDRLTKQKPRTLDETYETKLQDRLANWKSEYNGWLLKYNRDTINFTIDNLVSKTKYQYSYFQTNEPIDVYRTDLGTEINGNIDFKLFIGLDEDGKIFSEYKDGGWIINSCDSLNSIIQDIYRQSK